MARIGQSLIDIVKAFSTEENCLAYLEAARWPNGVHCVKCDHDKVSKFTTKESERKVTNRKTGEVSFKAVPARHLYQCLNAECGHQFTATVGTVFNDTHLPLTKWFMAIALMCNAKKGASAKQMERDLGISYRTAWYLCHRIRKAMAEGNGGLFGGTVEVDATFVGGRFDARRKRSKYGKQAVAGMIERGTSDRNSRVRVKPVAREIKPVMTGFIQDNVSLEATIHTDEHAAYRTVGQQRKHEMVRHSTDEWVRGSVHTNGIESFWSLLKRGIIGSYHQVSVKHLDRYLAEFTFRFNNREDANLFATTVLNLVIATGMKYAELTAASEPSASE